MNTEKLTPLEEKAAEALEKALANGEWLNSPFSLEISKIGLEALKRRDELEASAVNGNGPEARQTDGGDIDENGWLNESWAAWRLVLRTGENPSVIYFSRKPTYAECKAFARAALVPVAEAVIEERPE